MMLALFATYHKPLVNSKIEISQKVDEKDIEYHNAIFYL